MNCKIKRTQAQLTRATSSQNPEGGTGKLAKVGLPISAERKIRSASSRLSYQPRRSSRNGRLRDVPYWIELERAIADFTRNLERVNKRMKVPRGQTMNVDVVHAQLRAKSSIRYFRSASKSLMDLIRAVETSRTKRIESERRTPMGHRPRANRRPARAELRRLRAEAELGRAFALVLWTIRVRYIHEVTAKRFPSPSRAALRRRQERWQRLSAAPLNNMDSAPRSRR